MEQAPKYPTFQDKYGQIAQQQDTSFEQNKQPTETPPANLNPWASLGQIEQDPIQLEMPSKKWEFTGR